MALTKHLMIEDKMDSIPGSVGAGLSLQVLHELFVNVRALITWKSFFCAPGS